MVSSERYALSLIKTIDRYTLSIARQIAEPAKSLEMVNRFVGNSSSSDQGQIDRDTPAARGRPPKKKSSLFWVVATHEP
jgi:hypothetical protein